MSGPGAEHGTNAPEVVALGEVMLRLDPGEGRIRTARSFQTWEGGGEYNVVRGLRRCFGLRTAVVTLLTLLEGISGRTLRARVRRGLTDARAAGRTLAEHEAIFNALSARDAPLSQAAALLHVSSTEQWLREHLSTGESLPGEAAAG